MIPFRRFSEELFVLIELFLGWEGNAVDTLQRIVVGVSKEV